MALSCNWNLPKLSVPFIRIVWPSNIPFHFFWFYHVGQDLVLVFEMGQRWRPIRLNHACDVDTATSMSTIAFFKWSSIASDYWFQMVSKTSQSSTLVGSPTGTNHVCMIIIGQNPLPCNLGVRIFILQMGGAIPYYSTSNFLFSLWWVAMLLAAWFTFPSPFNVHLGQKRGVFKHQTRHLHRGRDPN